MDNFIQNIMTIKENQDLDNYKENNANLQGKINYPK